MTNVFYYTGTIFWIACILLLIYIVFKMINQKRWFIWIKNWGSVPLFAVCMCFMDKQTIQKCIVTLDEYIEEHDQLSARILRKLFQKYLQKLTI